MERTKWCAVHVLRTCVQPALGMWLTRCVHSFLQRESIALAPRRPRSSGSHSKAQVSDPVGAVSQPTAVLKLDAWIAVWNRYEGPSAFQRCSPRRHVIPVRSGSSCQCSHHLGRYADQHKHNQLEECTNSGGACCDPVLCELERNRLERDQPLRILLPDSRSSFTSTVQIQPTAQICQQLANRHCSLS